MLSKILKIEKYTINLFELLAQKGLIDIMRLLVGIDIGSTTVKVVVTDEQDNILFKAYERHLSKVREKAAEMLAKVLESIGNVNVVVAITGSAGLGVAKVCGLDFVQEVFATAGAVEHYIPTTDVVIELGGEDAKIIFFRGGLEQRMNGSCAGGTGAFIDQMATLLGLSISELDELSLKHDKIYNIASRCGVFAKSDIQPLLNQGASKENISAGIFQAVVDQTIAGLAQGKKIEGKVAFLGGPLTFLQGLRERFVDTLKLSEEDAIFPKDGQYFIAMGAALYARNLKEQTLKEIYEKLLTAKEVKSISNALPPLFESEADYIKFRARHSNNSADYVDVMSYQGDAYLGIDAGSTTVKLALITPKGQILHTFYASNQGNPVTILRDEIIKIHQLCEDRIKIKGSSVTGYGEDLVKTAFSVDAGLVETVAHFKAAKFFRPDVDFIIDIGGQDIKCFKIRNGVVDSIMLNEACSSGCGSFIETFAQALGYDISDFARMGLFAKHPVDLGSRCTVFINSSVKQAQKEGAGVDDISAGLSASVVKNAIYKVIRASSPSELGHNVVVQGGTFLNDAVLRSFENELGYEVTRASIAGLMGAFGAALYAKDLNLNESQFISLEEVLAFKHTSTATNCGLCGNKCPLTVNIFDGLKDSTKPHKFISGNRCERPLGMKELDDIPNLFKYKYNRIMSIKSKPGKRGKIGIPLGLNMYENLPFWHKLLTELDFEVVVSGESSRKMYLKGQFTIPSDTVCYPAKIIHGHIEELIANGINTIFYPCMTYNFKESEASDNHYNCPVVAYYPELINANISSLKDIKYLSPYFGLHRKNDFIKKASEFFAKEFDVPKNEVKRAVDLAYAEYESYMSDIRSEGERAIKYARDNGMNIIVLAGRPYHIDPEINHGIDRLISSYKLVIVTEDAISHIAPKQKVKVLNQWTYHARLYDAARYVNQNPDMQLVQLVSFGCGIDAITTDEIREITEKAGKLYTQLKIDEINNLGAAKIRIRSLISEMDARKKAK